MSAALVFGFFAVIILPTILPVLRIGFGHRAVGVRCVYSVEDVVLVSPPLSIVFSVAYLKLLYYSCQVDLLLAFCCR